MKRHPFDPWSFVLGLLFLGTGVTFLTNSVDLLHTSAARMWPIPLLAIGLLIVLTSARRVKQRHPQSATEQHSSADAESDPVSSAQTDRPA